MPIKTFDHDEQPNLPRSIPHSAIIEALETLGLDPMHVVTLRIGDGRILDEEKGEWTHGAVVEATVFVYDTEGHKMLAGNIGTAYVKATYSIPIAF